MVIELKLTIECNLAGRAAGAESSPPAGAVYERHWLGLVLTQPPQRHKDTKAHKVRSKFWFVIAQKLDHRFIYENPL